MTPVVSSTFLWRTGFAGLWLAIIRGGVSRCPVGCAVCRALGVRSDVCSAGPWGRLYIRNIYTVYLYIYQFTWRYRRYLRVFTGTYFGTYR